MDSFPFAIASSGPSITGLDWLMIALYFGLLLGVGWWVIRRRKDTAADYFLAGRNLSWWVIGASAAPTCSTSGSR
jgi:SSS family solute:Na+ symporter